MKKHILLLSVLFMSFGFLISSCKKSTVTMPAIILGKWNIITDSTYVGVGVTNHAVNYSGQIGDYFDFRKDGKLYTKEAMKMDTLNYKLTSDTTILIPSFGINLNGVTETSHITNLTNHHVGINAPISITPGGIFGRKVDLSR